MIAKYALRLVLAALITFGLHLTALSILELPLFDHKIVQSYIFNTVLALSILIALLRVRKTLQSSLGFLFLGSSFLKFALFFLLFYPIYHADGDIDTREFLTFFIPYGICLIFETLALVRVLSQTD